MKACPECGSNKVYRHAKDVDANGPYGPNLLPDLNLGIFSAAKFLPVVCKDCGLLRFYASDETLEKLGSSKHWELND